MVFDPISARTRTWLVACSCIVCITSHGAAAQNTASMAKAPNQTLGQGAHPLGQQGEMAGLTRFALIAVRYIPETSEKFSQMRIAHRDVETGTTVGGIAIGAGATAACTATAWIPQLCVAATFIYGSIGALLGGLIANFTASDTTTSLPSFGKHVELAGQLLRTGDTAPDLQLREQVYAATLRIPGITTTVLDTQPHPAVEVDYTKFASTAQPYDAALELTVLGLYFGTEAAGDPQRLHVPVRTRIVRLSDRKVLTDAVFLHATEALSAEEWRMHEADALRKAVRQSSAIIGQRIVSQLFNREK